MDGMGTAAENTAEQAVTENGAEVAEQAAETAEETSGAEQTAEEKETQKAADPAAEGKKKAAGEETSEEDQKAEEKQKETDPEAELKEREKTLQEREAALQKKEIEEAAKDFFKEFQLPMDDKILPLMQAGTKEETKSRVETLSAYMATALEAKLSEKLHGHTPVGTSGTVTSGDKTVADVFSAALRG